MISSPKTGWSLCILATLGLATGAAVEPRNRSVSASGQFIIYCDDRQVRSRVSSFTEDTKREYLRLLHERDEWKLPIVVSLEAAPPGVALAPPATVTLVNTVAGPKIDVAVQIGDDPSKASLDRHLVWALLLEMAYRERPLLKGGERYANPPWWLIEGMAQSIRKRGASDEPEIFRSILKSGKFPSLDRLMTAPSVRVDSAAGAVDRVCSRAMVDALLHLPGGPKNLVRFIRACPETNGDASALVRHFPTIGQSAGSLAKWWTLQIATLAQSGAWHGMGPVAAEKEFAALEMLDIVVDKAGRRQQFALTDFEGYLGLPGAKPALQAMQVRIVALSSRCDALFRPILAEYEEICRFLSAGKTTGIARRLADVKLRRQAVLHRAEKITDYLNWYEATQTPGSTGEFDSFLSFIESQTPKPSPPAAPDPRIVAYLDSLQRDFTPIRGSGNPPMQSPQGARP